MVAERWRGKIAAVTSGPPASRFLRAVDQVGNPVPDRSGNDQSRQRLFRRISADRSPCTSALLINGGGRFTRLVCDIACDTLDRIYRLNPGV